MTTTKRETHRTERVASRAHEELAGILRREFSDPRIKDVVLSHVHVTDDLSLARAAFVVMGDDPEGKRARAALKVLARLTPALRTKLAERLGIRRAPELTFALDEGREEVERLDALLHEVQQELAPKKG